MLGVATLIVVNSVMSGFSTKLRQRLHGVLSDVIVESYDHDGFSDPVGKMELIKSDPFLAERIEALTPTLEIFAMLQFNWGSNSIAKPVKLIGIEPEGRSHVGGFAEYLTDQRNQPPSFELSQEAKDYRAKMLEREQANRARFGLRPMVSDSKTSPPGPEALGPDGLPLPEPPPSEPYVPAGAILGYAIAHFRDPKTGEEICTLPPGANVMLTTLSGVRLRPVYSNFTVCNYFRSEMSEYDGNYVFVPLDYLQRLRTMEGRVTSIQIRLKDERQAKQVVARLREVLGWAPVHVLTWQDKQGPLLAAIDIEKGILNVLLFLIIAVAGFGILAIFSMIVVEKTRDIGILKALGASNGGVMAIFLGYGLLLGLVGAILGTILGISLTVYINEVEQFLAWLTGQEIFNRGIYYFKEIPTHIQASTVFLVNVGAVTIAVFFSILPALRAALLHPVRALRFE